MSIRNLVSLFLALSALALLSACGSSTHNAVAPPSGAFSNTDLNGTYTFSASGSDGNGIFTMAGSLVACGCSQGTISAGSVDLDDPSSVAPASAIGSNSTYNISSDGRGTAKLLISTSSSVSAAVEVDLDFVLTSSSHALIIRYDGNGTGSGTMDLQPSAVAQSSLSGLSYAFSLSGSDTSDNPLATVGAFTLDASGNIVSVGSTAGVEDFNYQATPTTQLSLTGSVVVGSGSTPGVASLNTTFGHFSFDVYTIDANHLKLIEDDGQAFLVGDVFTQSDPTIPSGNLVFSMEGLDTNGDIIAMGGLIASDGSSTITSGSEDVNDAGTVDNGTSPATPFTFSGSFAATGGGRYSVNLTGFVGGTNFAAYPSDGGLLLMEVDTGLNAGVASGTALAQTSGAAIAASEGYGLNLTGEDVVNAVELDEIAEFTTTSTGMSGLIDVNDGGPASPHNFSGNYTPGSNGAGSATFNTGLQSMFYYAADSSTVLFISTDPNQAALGSFQMQITPTAPQSAHVRAMPMLRAIPHASHSALKHSKARISFKK